MHCMQSLFCFLNVTVPESSRAVNYMLQILRPWNSWQIMANNNIQTWSNMYAQDIPKSGGPTDAQEMLLTTWGLPKQKRMKRGTCSVLDFWCFCSASSQESSLPLSNTMPQNLSAHSITVVQSPLMSEQLQNNFCINPYCRWKFKWHRLGGQACSIFHQIHVFWCVYFDFVLFLVMPVMPEWTRVQKQTQPNINYTRMWQEKTTSFL